MHSLLAILVFAAVLLLVVWRPLGLSIGWPAAGGGALALALGVVTPADVVQVLSLVWDATGAFVALVLISLVLDAIGFFEWAALHMVRASAGSGHRLFVYSILLGALVAALFTNDGAALILTPIVFQQARALRLPPAAVLALVMAGGFVADATSLPLVVSNLVNIVSADYFHLDFLAYAAPMLPVDAAALLASILTLRLCFRRSLPGRIATADVPEPATAIRDARLFRASWAVLGLLVAGYLASGVLRFPVSVAAGAAALLLLACAAGSPAVDVRRLVVEAPWKVVVFSVGMYVVVFGLRDAGLVALLVRSLDWAASRGPTAAILYAGFVAAAMSAVMSNLPAVLAGALAIHGAAVSGATRLGMALANVVGADVGPKLTPVGSLATLLWLHVLERRGMRIGWKYYCSIGAVLTLPVLAVTLLALAAVMRVGA